jgi:hypothetical protein
MVAVKKKPMSVGLIWIVFPPKMHEFPFVSIGCEEAVATLR